MSDTSMVPMPFSCTRTRKSSSPRSTGRETPGARPAEGARGKVKNRSPKLCAWLAWIWLPVTVLSDGVGWKDDAAAAVGWPAVAGAVGVVVGVVRAADGVVDLAGVAGAGLRRGASTVTCGSG